ncbi:two-component regulator system yien regulator component protein [Spiroplasma clarkii]|uniref:hypothetical protein n=1 Tax=Spiroplasma clarkii TaxID=2139 RepID=UPI000B54B05B|nr:hypothetical protein [Spiroplasma clarkii]ARU91662.1 two-component regulator system yien regulator component protein [Spiroplasma clarkii]
MLNDLDSLNAQISQIEAQYLRLTPYTDIFRGHLNGVYYLVDFKDGGENYKFCFISAQDWNRVKALPSEEFEVDLHFGPTQNKYLGSQKFRIRANKADQILLINENKRYQIQSDNPGEYNNQMSSLTQKVEELEQQVKEVSKKC